MDGGTLRIYLAVTWFESYNKTTYKLPTHAAVAQHTSAFSAAVLGVNINETVFEMTLP